MDLATVWFIIIAIFWTGFLILEGFDFGVGALHLFVGKNDTERRVAINSIGPFWDANEVWLIVGGAAIFAAFPAWYATMFSGLYLAMLLILVALIIRGVSFEWRGKKDSHRWRTGWSWAMAIGSALAPLLIGVGLGDLLVGLPIDSNEQYTGTFWNLLTPFGLLTGVVLLMLCLMHGAVFLRIRTTGSIHQRCRRIAVVTGSIAAVLVICWTIWADVIGSGSLLAIIFSAIAITTVVAVPPYVWRGADKQAFIVSAIALGATMATLFANLFPNVMVSSTSAANNLTVAGSASGSYALTVMTIVAVIAFPVVLLYQGWTYYVFRHRIQTPETVSTDS